MLERMSKSQDKQECKDRDDVRIGQHDNDRGKAADE
jgi:hypothetical protein